MNQIKLLQQRNEIMKKLEGKVAVITGGSTGIGLATAQRFVDEGANVFITGRRQSELDAAVKQIGKNNVTGVQGDVSNLADLDRLYATVKEQKGQLDILFANAGLGEFLPWEKISEAHYDKTFSVNVKGVLFTILKALPLFTNGGSIILMGSVNASTGTEGLIVYSATKAAVRSFARSFTSELKNRNIRINALSPGPIETPGLMNAVNSMGMTEDQFKKTIVSAIPMGRMGSPNEVANVVLFLASDDSSFVTGIELFVDGGMAQI
jgi:NAD(P)-dependent dehydrogenase (short-subunit alcohol dehydrogenase family)